MIEAGRWEGLVEPSEIARQVAFDCSGETFLGALLVGHSARCRLRQFCVDNGGGNRLVWIKRSQPTSQVFEFTHIARPPITLEAIECGLVDLLWWQPLLSGLGKEMADQI